MKAQPFISDSVIFPESFCAIGSNEIIVDGETVFRKSGPDFFADAYSFLGVNYPKFFKMDELSKLCFLTVEALLQKSDITRYEPMEKSVVIHNRNSSIVSDIRFNNSCHEIPSPAHFVYTLPNVMIGELCIRNQIKGENHCFVSETYDYEFQFDWIKKLLLSGSKVCIHGWVDYGTKGFSSLLFLTKNETPGNENKLRKMNLKQIIEQYAGAY